ncbi:OLC1v1025264C1 [Oldenlandia corymbosa var. corymbosa]|uniref:OLC1v1025264C1 n=1 Tax=Oldenlandia corymbosa var. corymbosa TaxID=529605 RepID=A0AAV1C4V3_OLDCO|nr:OLC1v1025264C1 [Oldenlandia corymbosa var. corymbosa]
MKNLQTKKIRIELEERQKQQTRLLMSAIGEGVMKKLKEKDEQIQRMGKLNLALQERVKSLYVENQLWRDLAQTNEAAANTLRTNLEQVLAHVTDERLSASLVPTGGATAAAAAEDDAESCCGSCDYGRENEEEHQSLAGDAGDKGDAGATATGGNRMCKGCGERESCVLLLPCRHLCLCTQCGSTLLRSCPVCNSNMNATVHVNLSS